MLVLQAGSLQEPLPEAEGPSEAQGPASSPTPGGGVTGGDLLPVVVSNETVSGYSTASFTLSVQQQVSALTG